MPGKDNQLSLVIYRKWRKGEWGSCYVLEKDMCEWRWLNARSFSGQCQEWRFESYDSELGPDFDTWGEQVEPLTKVPIDTLALYQLNLTTWKLTIWYPRHPGIRRVKVGDIFKTRPVCCLKEREVQYKVLESKKLNNKRSGRSSALIVEVVSGE